MKKHIKTNSFFKLYFYYYKDVYMQPQGSCTPLTSCWGDAPFTTLRSKYKKFKQNYNNILTKNP